MDQQPLDVLDEMSPEELQAMNEAAAIAEAEKFEKREALGKILVKHRDEAVKFRLASGIESQWSEDQAYYEGQDESDRTLYYKGLSANAPLIAKPKSKYRSKVFLNITRPYVETAASKVIEVLSPSDARQWSLEATAIPNFPEQPSPLVQALELAMAPPQQPQVDANGQPVPEAPPQVDPVIAMQEAAVRAAKGAQLWIDDKLQECDISGVIRAVVDESSRLGTGVIRGPVPTVRRTIKVETDPNTQVDKVTVLEEVVPESKSVSVWDCYPDPACGDNIHDGQYFLEHDRMVEKQVRNLIGQPGYIQEAIMEVLETGIKTGSTNVMARRPHDSLDPTADRYHVWYYYGFLMREDVLAMNCECSEEDAIANIGVPVVVTMINDTPVKAHLNPMDDGSFPYNFMCWQRVAGSPFGIGIARQIRSCQAILNSHVRAMMENAGLSTGPQIVVSRGSVVPADGSWEITPRKVWLLKPDADIQDVTKALFAAMIPSNQSELLAAIDFALKMAENVTGLPILLQGQQGPNGVPETLGGMQILVSNASSLLRRMARIFDDYLTKPHIQAYYKYMMLYAEDSSIKGDFKIIAHGASALVARDQRNTFITQSCPQLMANPSFGIDPTRLFKQIAKINGMMDIEEITFTPQEMVKVQQQQQQMGSQDPRIIAAEVTAQARTAIAQMNDVTAQMRIKRDTDRDTQYVQAETRRTQVTAEVKMAELQMRRELAMLDYANREKITLDQLKAKLAIEGGRNDLARELATLPTVSDVAEGIRSGGQVPDRVGAEGAGQTVPSAVPEVPGRAPAGLGFAL